jgi:hypothetical protein
MLNIPSTVSIFLHTRPTDMRNYAVLEIMPSPQRSRRVNWSLQAF